MGERCAARCCARNKKTLNVETIALWLQAIKKDPDYVHTLSHGGVIACQGNFSLLSPGLRTLLAGMLAPLPENRVPMSDLVEFLSEPRAWFAAESGGTSNLAPATLLELSESPDRSTADGDWRKSSSCISPEDEASAPQSWFEFRTDGPVHLARSYDTRWYVLASSLFPAPQDCFSAQLCARARQTLDGTCCVADTDWRPLLLCLRRGCIHPAL